MNRFYHGVSAAILGLVSLEAIAMAQGPVKQPSKGLSSPRISPDLARLRELEPAERLKFIENLAGAKPNFQAAAQGDLVVSVLERGSLEPANSADLVCKVKSRGKEGTATTTIKWVIEDGSIVKKGDRLIQLDDSFLREHLQLAKVKVLEAEAARVEVNENVRLARRENEIEVRLAEIVVEIAATELKNAPKGQSKQILELKLEEAKLKLEKAQALAKSRPARATAEERARSAVLELEMQRLRDLESELQQCVMTAPMDGLAVYYVPSSGRFAGGSPTIAPGEPVREGQKLMRVCDLSKMVVSTRVHESQISRLRVGHVAEVRVDAYPQKAFSGKVSQISTIASAPDFIASDVRVYPVTVTIDDGVPGLKPGMSADVRIVADEHKNVLMVPVQAIWTAGRERFCFVKVGQELHERKIVIGASNATSVEIKEGLKADEQVLLNPQGFIGINEKLEGGQKGGPKKGPPMPDNAGASLPRNVLLARSVRPTDDSPSRSFVLTYGLTRDDHKRFAALPDVEELTAVRFFPRSVSNQVKSSDSTIIATTANFANFHTLKLEGGRFLTEDDEQLMRNVVVLGKSVAADLFPDTKLKDPSIVIAGHNFQVVGRLGAQSALPGKFVADPDNAVYIPLSTCRSRLGDINMIRTAGSRSAEAVLFHAFLMRVKPENIATTATDIRSLLEKHHERRDWQVETPQGR